MMIHPHCQFKNQIDKDRFPYLHDICQEIMYDMAEWCEDKKIPFEVTATISTLSEDTALNRVSSTHRTGRAFDVSIRQWLPELTEEFAKDFETKFAHYGALGQKSGKEELILRHDCGHGDHIHVQIAARFAIINPLEQPAKPL